MRNILNLPPERSSEKPGLTEEVLKNLLNGYDKFREGFGVMYDEGMLYVVNSNRLVFRRENNRDTLVLEKVFPNSFQANNTGRLSFFCTKFSTDFNPGSGKQDYVIKKVVYHDGVA